MRIEWQTVWTNQTALGSISVPILRLFSSPGQSPGRAIVLPPASALAAASVLAKCGSFYVKVFICDGQGAVKRAILSL